MKYEPHPYQLHATEHLLRNKACGLFLDMGLGKTVATATGLNDLLFNSLETDKILVIAPKRVAEITWPDELKKWDHLRHLRISVVAGSAAERIAALKRPADIYVIGRDNVSWLVKGYEKYWPFKVVVIDELSSFKNPEAKRFKNLRRVRPLMHRVIGLTGTPAPKSLMDLWSQMFLLDAGERLGKHIGGFRDHYFVRGYESYQWDLRPGADEGIHGKIRDICISMKAEDWLTLPGRSDQVVKIPLSDELWGKYEELKEECVLSLIEQIKAEQEERLDGLFDETDIEAHPENYITAANSSGLRIKLAQFCNGAVYTETATGERVTNHIHDLKLEAVREDLEALNGQPFLLFYQFQHDKERLLRGLKEYEPRELKTKKDIDDWNDGKVRLLITHAASAGHGLNLQHGGHNMGWFGLTEDLELYLQACARLDRQGQTRMVVNRMYLVPGSVEMMTLGRIQNKDKQQQILMNAVKAMVTEYLKKHKT